MPYGSNYNHLTLAFDLAVCDYFWIFVVCASSEVTMFKFEWWQRGSLDLLYPIPLHMFCQLTTLMYELFLKNVFRL